MQRVLAVLGRREIIIDRVSAFICFGIIRRLIFLLKIGRRRPTHKQLDSDALIIPLIARVFRRRSIRPTTDSFLFFGPVLRIINSCRA